MKHLKSLFLSGLAMLGMFATAAHAEIPASVGTALEAVKTDASSLQALVIPIVVAVLGMTLVISLIKRFGNKI